MGYPGGGVDPEDPTAVSKTTETLQKVGRVIPQR